MKSRKSYAWMRTIPRTTMTTLTICLALLMPSLARAQPPRLRIDLIEVDPATRCAGTVEQCLALQAALYHYAGVPAALDGFWDESDAYWYTQIHLATELTRKDAELRAAQQQGFTAWHVVGVAGAAGVVLGMLGIVVGFMAR